MQEIDEQVFGVEGRSLFEVREEAIGFMGVEGAISIQQRLRYARNVAVDYKLYQDLWIHTKKPNIY